MSGDARVHLQFEDFEKQTHAARLGMWLVVVSEILLFAALFALYASYRVAYPHAFAEATHHTSFWLAGAMTGILVTSSLFVALALHAVRSGRVRHGTLWLAGAAGLGVAFLVVKGFEYHEHLSDGIRPGVHYAFETLPDPGARVFFTLYYLMTGLHGLHVLVGVGVLSVLAWGVHRRRFSPRYPTPVELGGLYWHLVDAVWIFLWPLFYLMR